MITVEVEIACGAWRGLDHVEELAQRAAAAAWSALPGAAGDEAAATLLLADDAAIRELNRTWRGQDKATNVLSFPAPPLPAAPRHLGEIALAYETVAAEAKRDGIELGDHAAHLIVHGLLHLLGHDHIREEEAERMERLETLALARLGIADPYRGSGP